MMVKPYIKQTLQEYDIQFYLENLACLNTRIMSKYISKLKVIVSNIFFDDFSKYLSSEAIVRCFLLQYSCVFSILITTK